MQINGKVVVNSKRKIKLEISAIDVRKGRMKDPSTCAAAQCLLRTVPGILSARVHKKMTYIEFENRWERLLTPTALQHEIVAFDRGAAFYPGNYMLRPLSPAEQLRYDQKHNDKFNRPNKSKRIRPYHITEGIRGKRGANK